ncbi:MAG: 5'(3')-deoxyribonucleotidase, partial [Chitinophagaceae bacterium]|nr:5'(3')-deoxyribonucleotidase [Chitinophagaceae bacterium]
MKRVLVDMDEVIADPMTAMIDWYTKEYGLEVDYTKMNGSWAFGFPEQHQKLIRQRLNEPGFFRHLPVMKDSQRVLKEINEKYELFIVSAATEFPNSLKDKIDWLQDHFSFISWKQVVLCWDKRRCVG